MAEQADAGDLKSPGQWPCGFESRPRHLRNRGGFWAFIIGLVVGTVLDWGISNYLPSHPARDFFIQKVQFGIPEFTIDLIMLTFSFSLMFKFSIIMITTALIFYFVYRNL